MRTEGGCDSRASLVSLTHWYDAECFLQFKKPTSHKPVQCPFCNAFNYAVKYSGSVTKEEREAIEQVL